MLPVSWCVVVCELILFKMRSYPLLIRFANIVREIMSLLGRLIQVLAALWFRSTAIGSP